MNKKFLILVILLILILAVSAGSFFGQKKSIAKTGANFISNKS